jgi:hypothetical protein
LTQIAAGTRPLQTCQRYQLGTIDDGERFRHESYSTP